MSLFWSIVIGAAGAILIAELISISLNASAIKCTLDGIRDILQVTEANSPRNNDSDDDIDHIVEARLKQRPANRRRI
jgi:hypothetical protein